MLWAAGLQEYKDEKDIVPALQELTAFLPEDAQLHEWLQYPGTEQ